MVMQTLRPGAMHDAVGTLQLRRVAMGDQQIFANLQMLMPAHPRPAAISEKSGPNVAVALRAPKALRGRCGLRI
jgi:hypothetical protein